MANYHHATATVNKLLTSARPEGFISCSVIDQPHSPTRIIITQRVTFNSEVSDRPICCLPQLKSCILHMSYIIGLYVIW